MTRKDGFFKKWEVISSGAIFTKKVMDSRISNLCREYGVILKKKVITKPNEEWQKNHYELFMDGENITAGFGIEITNPNNSPYKDLIVE